MSFFLNTDSAVRETTRSVGGHRRRLDRTFRQLSSGVRFAHAGEDPVGITTAARISGHLTALTQGLDNIKAGQEMARVAEGTLGEIATLVHRLRELAIQGANDTVSEADRANMQDEFSSLMEEITRMAERTQYNDRPLLDGTLQQLSFQVGAFAGERVSVQMPDARATALGRQAVATGAAVSLDALEAGDLTLNGVAVRATVAADDEESTVSPLASAKAKAAAINDSAALHGVTAVVLPSRFDGAQPVSAGVLDSDNALVINGEIILADLTQEAPGGALVDAINAKMGDEVVARLDAQGSLVLEAKDGRNIEVVATGNAAAIAGVPAASVATGSLYLYSDADFTFGGADEAAVGFGDNQQVLVSLDEALSEMDISTQIGADKATLVLDRVLEEISGSRASLGVAVNRFETMVDAVSNQMERLTEARSLIEDTDFAQASAALARSQVLEQASIGMLAQANTRRQGVLSLLQQ